ncbi:MAG: MarR family transcriptional regulator [Flavobacteriia bacterium]|nr:MAG: MarR family transcriptional regulator [Flavobacteriia bacterium]
MLKEDSIDHYLRATWQAVSKMYNEQAAKRNSTMSMAFVLLNIDFDNGTPSTALGPQMGMEATSLSRILKNMEEKGAIYREANPDDGRSILIKLTEKGKKEREFAKSVVLHFNSVVRRYVTPEQIDGFFEVMKTINRLIKSDTFFQSENNITTQ